MALTNLPEVMQSLIIFQYEMFFKYFIFAFLLIFAIAYLYIFSKNEQPTPFFLVGITRLMKYFLCKIYLFFAPLLLLLLTPTIGLSEILNYLIIGYFIFGVVFFVIFLFNVFYFGGAWIFDLMNVSMDNKRFSQFKKILSNKNWDLYDNKNR
jgi:hypothetical protein